MFAPRQIRPVHPAQSVPQQRLCRASPICPAAQVKKVSAPGLGMRRFKFGVTRRIARVLVMREMEVTEPKKGQGEDGRDQMPNRIVQPCWPKRRPVRAFVAECEQKDQQHPVRQQHRLPKRQAHRDVAARQTNRAQMSGKMHKPAQGAFPVQGRMNTRLKLR